MSNSAAVAGSPAVDDVGEISPALIAAKMIYTQRHLFKTTSLQPRAVGLTATSTDQESREGGSS
jgi:hypothetical protein